MSLTSDPIIARLHKHVSHFALCILGEILLSFLIHMVERCQLECLFLQDSMLPFGRWPPALSAPQNITPTCQELEADKKHGLCHREADDFWSCQPGEVQAKLAVVQLHI